LDEHECLKQDYIPKIETSVGELYEKYREEHASLTDIKKRIAKGNVGIQDKLIELSEAKSELSKWRSMKSLCRNSEISIFPNTHNGSKQYTVQHYQIDRKTIQKLLDDLQKIVETLQDEVDTYNASTLV
jgi:DNA-directed RNA polymerase subunit F